MRCMGAAAVCRKMQIILGPAAALGRVFGWDGEFNLIHGANIILCRQKAARGRASVRGAIAVLFCRNMNPMSSQDFAIAIMAAGKGTRLKSKRPKVLHEVGGKPLLAHVIRSAAEVVPAQNIYVIIGHEAERVRAAVADM